MSYMGAHNRTRRVRGRAAEKACVTCGGQAREWALIHDAAGVERDIQGRLFSRDPMDYQAMCKHCHQIYDKSLITECPHGHEYTPENTLLDAGKRKCKTCVYTRNRARKPSQQQKARKIELQRIRRAHLSEAAA
jgi:hypothetical protein